MICRSTVNKNDSSKKKLQRGSSGWFNCVNQV
jgi:hypothetical protein